MYGKSMAGQGTGLKLETRSSKSEMGTGKAKGRRKTGLKLEIRNPNVESNPKSEMGKESR
jgi:hypothetical protein